MASTIFDELPETQEEVAPSEPAEIITRQGPRDPQEEIKGVEDELYADSLGVIRDTLAFREIDPSLEEPPEEWVKQLGTTRAWEKFRVAQAAWMSGKEHPIGIKVAMNVGTNIIRARSAERAAPKMAVNMVTLTVPAGHYPVQEVDE